MGEMNLLNNSINSLLIVINQVLELVISCKIKRKIIA